MSWYVVVDNSEPEPLATIYGWKLFKEWVLTLPPEPYPSIVEFAETGFRSPIDTFAVELDAAIEASATYPAPDPGTLKIASDLAQTLRAAFAENPAADFAYVSDGMVADDGEDEDEDIGDDEDEEGVESDK